MLALVLTPDAVECIRSSALQENKGGIESGLGIPKNGNGKKERDAKKKRLEETRGFNY